MSIPNLKYKTTLCKNWEEGTPCEKGIGCYFAHGQQQLRKLEENQQLIADRNMYLLNYQYSNNYKTVYCKFYAKGQCKLGTSCTFAHQKKQKRKIHKNNLYQQSLPIPYLAYNIPFYYPQYCNFGGQIYYLQTFQHYQNNSNIDLKEQDLNLMQQTNEMNSRSEEKKRSHIEQSSTYEKTPIDIENQEENSQTIKQSSCFNIQ